jgi:hypothetical protein
MKLLLAGLLILAGSVGAEAKPAELSTAIKADQPYGAGSYKVIFITAYDAALWTDAQHWSMQVPFALTLSYHMSFSSADIIERSLDEMKQDDPAIDAPTLARYRADMLPVFPAVRAGDEITGLYQPDGTTQFFLNGRPTGQVHDRNFAAAFFGIWLSPHTTAPDLRASLLRLQR